MFVFQKAKNFKAKFTLQTFLIKIVMWACKNGNAFQCKKPKFFQANTKVFSVEPEQTKKELSKAVLIFSKRIFED